MSKADLEKKPFDVARMFDAVGKKYDITNTVLSFGQDARWRRLTRERLNLKPGEKVLDLAAGTAVSTEELSKSGAWCVACDFSLGMLAAGAERDVPKVAGDGMRLPFADNTFDAVTISYGLRNIHDFELGLREMARVTKPGGRLAGGGVLQAGHPGLRHRLQGIPDPLAAADCQGGLLQPGGLYLPRRVHPRVAGAARAGRRH